MAAAMPPITVTEGLVRELLGRVGVTVSKVDLKAGGIVIRGRVLAQAPRKPRRKGPEVALDIAITGRELEAPIAGLPQPGRMALDPAALAAAAAGMPSEAPPGVLELFAARARQQGPPPELATATASGLPAYDPMDAFRTK